jgi:hypothetical protein
MGRDALFADIEVSTSSQERPKQSTHLCTTHLVSLSHECPYRKRQLADNSALPKASQVGGYENIAGIVGGDMNVIEKWDHDTHPTHEADLKDVWKDEPSPPILFLKPFKKDLLYGRATGNTSGYQSDAARSEKHLDICFYMNRVEIAALSKPEDVTRLDRVGFDFVTEIEVWVNLKWPGGTHETYIHYAMYHSETEAMRLRERYGDREFNARYVKKKNGITE